MPAQMTFEQYEALPWRAVDSSNIQRVAWQGDGTVDSFLSGGPVVVGKLTIEFQGNRAYHYEDVSEEIFQELLEADSVGGYFNSEIKPNHEARRIEVVAS